MRDQSPIERTVRATLHARAALLAGFTTCRDLGTEALGTADAALRDCVNRGLIPGPRLFVATEAIASSGGYQLRSENRLAVPPRGGSGRGGGGGGGGLPRAADVADGVEGVRAAVRRRVGDGADVVKVYADYRRRVMRFPPDVEGPGGRVLFPPDRRERNPAVVLFSREEMEALVEEARLADVPVAAHAGEARTALMAVKAGVTSVEHVFEDREECVEELVEEMVKRETVWVPTLATAEESFGRDKFNRCKERAKMAFDKGVRLAAGGDTGVFNHGLNAREMEIMMEAGIPVEEVLVAGTYAGWLACGGDACGFRFGWWDEGNRADVVALNADPREDRKALRKVGFVMKDGRVWKRDGLPVGMIPPTQWSEEADDLAEQPAPRSGHSTSLTADAAPFIPALPGCTARPSGNPTSSELSWETDSFGV
ncbi:hypothetical protein C8A05DRAFT_44253 [Staphylotrichum tortipilum]|uniref:Amidohydrolase-related domain-containing protein n=1 Tax=Staphylotrichum tortipilum TaxID=2831512 RepID=A0AAN6RTD6_9PEZI|nr:hypothetical protein C8A05DRAFT_44253 [Staphylotrichum longicolle]